MDKESTMKLSHCQIGTVLTILLNTKNIHAKGRRCIVVNRWPEDRSSGITKVHFEDNGDRFDYIWDHDDPLVEVHGSGKLTFKIEMDS